MSDFLKPHPFPCAPKGCPAWARCPRFLKSFAVDYLSVRSPLPWCEGCRAGAGRALSSEGAPSPTVGGGRFQGAGKRQAFILPGQTLMPKPRLGCLCASGPRPLGGQGQGRGPSEPGASPDGEAEWALAVGGGGQAHSRPCKNTPALDARGLGCSLAEDRAAT